MAEDTLTSETITLMKEAEEIFQLGEHMTTVFGKAETDKRSYMIMAIAAGLKRRVYKYSEIIGIDEVTKIRKEKGLTLRQIEDATGISNSYLSQLENGKIKNPSQNVMLKLVNFVVKDIPTVTDSFDSLVPGSNLKGL